MKEHNVCQTSDLEHTVSVNLIANPDGWVLALIVWTQSSRLWHIMETHTGVF